MRDLTSLRGGCWRTCRSRDRTVVRDPDTWTEGTRADSCSQSVCCAVSGPGPFGVVWSRDATMASVLLVFSALLHMSVHGSTSAGVSRQQLVAVLCTAASEGSTYNLVETGGSAFSVSRDVRTTSIGANGISCALAVCDDAAAGESFRTHKPPCAASEGGYPLGGRLVKRSSVNGVCRLCVDIGLDSALDRINDRDAAANQVDRSVDDVLAPHEISASSKTQRSLDASGRAAMKPARRSRFGRRKEQETTRDRGRVRTGRSYPAREQQQRRSHDPRRS